MSNAVRQLKRIENRLRDLHYLATAAKRLGMFDEATEFTAHEQALRKDAASCIEWELEWFRDNKRASKPPEDAETRSF